MEGFKIRFDRKMTDPLSNLLSGSGFFGLV